MSAPTPQPSPPPSLVRGLSARDAVFIVIGGVVGSAIFLTPQQVAQALPSPPLFLFVWIAGGLVSLMGAISLAELGAMFPEAGGQYVYFREAYGEIAGFLYGWLTFVSGSSGSIATLAVAFAAFLSNIAPALRSDAVLATVPGVHWRAGALVGSTWHLTRGDVVSVSAIVALTAINIRGLRPGVLLQNTATWLKYIVLAVFIVLGIAIGNGDWSHFNVAGLSAAAHGGWRPFISGFGVAFIAVFWAYDGWVYAAWAAGEVRQPERNVPRAMIFGVLCVIVLYCSMNAIYLFALPLDEIKQHTTIARAAADKLFSPAVGFWVAAVIAISCLGACCSNVLAGARVTYAMGRDGIFFRRMGNVHPRFRTPNFALAAQGLVAAAIALSGTYDQLFTFTVFGMVLSYFAAVVALFVLRRTRPLMPRPYRCAGYPWLPGLYALLIGSWLLNTVIERPEEAIACLGLFAIGLPGYFYWRRQRLNRDAAPKQA
jgi:APA family basic amino acid/polyamine antiporter